MEKPNETPEVDPQPQSTPRTASNRPQETVRLLGIFHFVYAGMIVVGSFFPVIWLTLLGIWWPELAAEANGGELPVMVTGSVGMLFLSFGILMAWIWAGLLVHAGRSLLSQRRHTYCQVIAAVTCLAFPLGTVLGVATLVVLSREDVRRQFAQTDVV